MGKAAGAVSSSPSWGRPLLYAALNIASASGIVFANKYVFTTYQFAFTCALTWVHTVFTLVGMRVFLAAGMFERKDLPAVKVLPLAAAYVAYIVLCNLSLNVNPVSFYQVMKIAVAPTVMFLELAVYRKVPAPRVVASVMLVCVGVGAATVTDTQMARNAKGLAVGLGATLVTAMYQIWAGTKQKELRASSMQLLHQYTPQAALLLGLLVPLLEPIGLHGGSGSSPPRVEGPYGNGTLLGYHFTPAAVGAILLSAALGLLVSLSTFLVIGATSSLTYNVVGHLKTIIILAGGCILFDDAMPLKKLAGVGVAMAGIVWYSLLQLQGSQGGAGGAGSQGMAAAKAAAAAAAGGGAHHQHHHLKSGGDDDECNPLLPVSTPKASDGGAGTFSSTFGGLFGGSGAQPSRLAVSSSGGCAAAEGERERDMAAGGDGPGRDQRVTSPVLRPNAAKPGGGRGARGME